MKLEGVRVIMFDFDGTLIDSMPFLSSLAVKLIKKIKKIH